MDYNPSAVRFARSEPFSKGVGSDADGALKFDAWTLRRGGRLGRALGGRALVAERAKVAPCCGAGAGFGAAGPPRFLKRMCFSW